MKIGITDDSYTAFYGVDEGLSRIAEHGYDAVDAQILARIASPLFALPLPAFEKEIRAYRAAVRRQGLVVSQTHGPWRSADDYRTPEARRYQFDGMVRALYGTALLGCDKLVLHPVMPTGAVDRDPDESREINLAFFSALLVEAEKAGVRICLENMPFVGQGLARPKETLALVRALDSRYCGVCLDTGHAAIFGISPADAVRAIGKEHLLALHIHDNDGNRDLHLLPGEGVIDWEAFSSALHEIGFSGVFSLETEVSKKIEGPARDRPERDLAALARRLADGKK